MTEGHPVDLIVTILALGRFIKLVNAPELGRPSDHNTILITTWKQSAFFQQQRQNTCPQYIKKNFTSRLAFSTKLMIAVCTAEDLDSIASDNDSKNKHLIPYTSFSSSCGASNGDSWSKSA